MYRRVGLLAHQQAGRVFNTGPHVLTTDFNPGDIGYVPRNYGHYVQNIGDTDMQFFAVFRTSNLQEISLSDRLKHTPAEMVAEHLNVDPTMVPHWPGSRGVAARFRVPLLPPSSARSNQARKRHLAAR